VIKGQASHQKQGEGNVTTRRGGKQPTEKRKFTGNKSPASHQKILPEGQKASTPEGKTTSPKAKERDRQRRILTIKSVVLRVAKPWILIGCNKKSGK